MPNRFALKRTSAPTPSRPWARVRANGWALFIAMHGGGGAPQELNDSQWRHMQIYYRDHPEAGGYLYVALRAPDKTWNGFYTGYVYPLIQNLLRQFLLFGDVDPNKRFLMGYSHGGYGAFAIGPKMPDYFAAIHASAGAPADGAGPITLRNTVFSCMVGEKDTMYGRYDRIQEFARDIQKLRGDRADIYPVSVQIIADHPHSGLPDRDKIADLYPAVRNPVPRELTWRLTDGVIRDFFWLHVPAPAAGQELSATCRENHLTVTTTTNLTSASVLLDSRLIDFNKPVTLEFNGWAITGRSSPACGLSVTRSSAGATPNWPSRPKLFSPATLSRDPRSRQFKVGRALRCAPRLGWRPGNQTQNQQHRATTPERRFPIGLNGITKFKVGRALRCAPRLRCQPGDKTQTKLHRAPPRSADFQSA